MGRGTAAPPPAHARTVPRLQCRASPLAPPKVVRVMSHMGRGRAASLLALRTVMLVVFVVCIAPMAVLGLPLFIPRWYATRRARLAVASSSVKLEGKDVLATWKVRSLR